VVLALLGTTLLGATAAPAVTPCATPPAGFPESGLVPGTTGTGYTTLSGTTPTPFTVEVVGVIPNGWMLGLDAIAVRLTGPPSFLDATGGIFFGMSGSPVYVNGALAGAVSGVFYDDATFGLLTPAQNMVDLLGLPGYRAADRPVRSIEPTRQVRRAIAKAEGLPASAVTGSFERLPLPLGVSGLSDAQIAELQRRLDKRGADFRVYSTASARAQVGQVTALPFQPGQPLGVAVSYGDASYYATGTATFTCGDTVVAFGHPFFYDAPGEISLGLSGASVLMVLGGGVYPGSHYALLTQPRGQINQDRFAGVVGTVGVIPPSVPITSELSSPDSGISRDGTTEAIHTWGWWLEEIVWAHVYSNIAAVFQHYGGGTSGLAWTIDGTREDGTPFTVTNRGMFWSEWDAGQTVWKLLSAIDLLQFNEFEKVTFTGVDVTGSVTKQRLEGDILRVRTSSGLQPALRSRNVTKVKAGRALTVEVTIAPLDGSPDVVATAKLRIPQGARGTEAVTVRGGKDRTYYRLGRVGSFETLIDALSGGQHENDLIVSGFGTSTTTVLDWMPNGKMFLQVQAV
jgi:hypothetical protein